ncbi:MAG: hypothetical protein R3B09_35350 [Nannocystaceae bacterium]
MLGLQFRHRGLAASSLAALLGQGCSGVRLEDNAGSDTAGVESSSSSSTGDASSTDASDTSSETDSSPETTADTTGATSTGTSTGADTETGTDTGADLCNPGEVFNDGACCAPMGLWPEGSAAIVHATFDVKVNGQPVNQGESDDGALYLVSAETGDRILIGKTTFGTLESRVLPGVYDLVYESESQGARLPWNRSVVVSPAVAVYDETPIAVNIPVVAVTTEILVDGESPPQGVLDDADIFLVDGKTGSRTHVARTSLLGGGGKSFTANLVPGTYEVRYASNLRKTVMPYNADTSIGAVEIVNDAKDGDLPVAVKSGPIAIATQILDGDLFFGDVPAPDSPLDHGRLYVRDVSSGSITLIADTSFGRVDKVPILDLGAGSYELVYGMIAHQSLAPMNEWATVGEAMDAATLAKSITSLHLDTVAISGSVKIDGATPTNDPQNSGHLILGRGGDRARIGGSNGTLAGLVLAAAYDPYFRHDFSDGGLPVNTRGRIQAGPVDVAIEPVLDLSIATATIHGAFTFGGDAASASAYDSGRIFLRSADGDAVHLGLSSDKVFSRRIILGEYTIVYAVESSQGGAPQNHEVEIGALVVQGDDVLADIDVPTIHTSISNPAKTDPGQGSGRYFLRRVGTSDEIFVGVTGADSFEVTVVPGDYELIYRVDILGDNVPWNSGAVLGCYHVEGG